MNDSFLYSMLKYTSHENSLKHVIRTKFAVSKKLVYLTTEWKIQNKANDLIGGYFKK